MQVHHTSKCGGESELHQKKIKPYIIYRLLDFVSNETRSFIVLEGAQGVKYPLTMNSFFKNTGLYEKCCISAGFPFHIICLKLMAQYC